MPVQISTHLLLLLLLLQLLLLLLHTATATAAMKMKMTVNMFGRKTLAPATAVSKASWAAFSTLRQADFATTDVVRC